MLPDVKIIKLNGQGDVVKLLAQGQIVQCSKSLSDLMEEVLGPTGFAGPVLLSLADATFLDSAGVGWLLKCNKRFRDAGGSLVIHSIPPVVLDIMNVMRLSQVLKLCEDEESALATIQGVKS
jgi:anti-anti-sigma factor